MWPLPLVFVLPRDWETLDFLSVPFIFLFGFVLFRGWEDGEGEEEAAGIELWNIPLSLLTPRSAGPGLGVAFGFLRAPALLRRRRILAAGGSPALWQQSRDPPRLQALPPGREPPRESGWRSLSVCPGGARGRAQPGNLALALPGAVPKGWRWPGESPERAEEPAPLPWAQPRGVFLLLSFRVPTSLDQPKSCSQRCWKGLAHRCCCRARRLLPRQAERAGRPAGRTQVLLQLNFSPHWKPSEFYFLVVFV